ncbi:MAG: phosphoribosylformylglycinamidine synthase subunit PurQ [Halofilum sp. (in: g-proteobacteria)]|nr:phosphoribosylformylglycinamidine synthase subunit PurQ [Halofilum sp. (in: g-proteobacteria)]
MLREQGVNGQVEMAAAFDRAGFEAVDVHMSDLLGGPRSPERLPGAGRLRRLLLWRRARRRRWLGQVHPVQRARRATQFDGLLRRAATRFALGVCNGCQMLASLRELIPGAEHWPQFLRNRSEQFEGRAVAGRGDGVAVAVPRGHGRLAPADRRRPRRGPRRPGAAAGRRRWSRWRCATWTTVGRPPRRYPANPNGSPRGVTGLTSDDGRVTIMMPHPERVFRTVQHSWHPPDWGEDGPWLRLFRNARRWLG